ncbi:MAG: 3-keto-5-aminohexanoate cleavage protein, partial [Ktedonobacteraceae bacterium]|nr:3-keto-5-aminohexanoate cleavage protein [Ktedonobacteraceae bacterium]
SDGIETLVAQDCGAAIATIQASNPGIPIGVSTALWIEPDVQHRLTLIEAWQALPDYASVNFSEPGMIDLCNLLLTKGIGIEAGIWTIDDAWLLRKSGIADHCLRLLIEPPEKEIAAALATVEAIEHCLDEGNIKTPRLLHGQDATTWPLLELALRRGYDTRIGLEDTLMMPDGRVARDNAELVSVACKMAGIS